MVSKLSLKILRHLKKAGVTSDTEIYTLFPNSRSSIESLLASKMIASDHVGLQANGDWQDHFVISDLGNAVLEEAERSSARFHWSEFRAWITRAIALAAFALSVIALYLQYK